MKYLMDGHETERLKYRLLHPADAEVWTDLFRQEGVAKFVALDHLATPEEQCGQWFERGFKRYADGLGGLNVLLDKQTGLMVGQCGLLVQEVEGVKRLEVGYSILPQYWGKGYATEAARKCRDHAFEQGFTDDLISIIHVENEPSMEVARRNGMQMYKSIIYKEKFPVNIFRITREEWQAMRG